jgi:hypothetical protein
MFGILTGEQIEFVGTFKFPVIGDPIIMIDKSAQLVFKSSKVESVSFSGDEIYARTQNSFYVLNIIGKRR